MNQKKISAAQARAEGNMVEIRKAVKQCKRGDLSNFKLIGDFVRQNSPEALKRDLDISLQEYNIWAKMYFEAKEAEKKAAHQKRCRQPISYWTRA